jgi:hypothetical protein
MLSSISPSSLKQYNVYFKKWHTFCLQNSVNLYEAPVSKILEFLSEHYSSGSQYGYGSLNSCRAALSLLLGPDVIADDKIHRFFKGVFRLRPPKPKYDITWDTSCVLDHLKTQFPNEDLTLERLTKKCCTLLSLVTAHRMQTLSKIKINNIDILDTKIIIKIPDLIKTSRLGANQPIIVLPFFREKPEICPSTTLTSYINRTATLRSSETLFVSFKKPYKPVTTQTLSRWIKGILNDSGIDVSMFSAHSTRHASSSRAYSCGVNIDLIRKTAGWSESSGTFAKFYNRTILDTNEASFASAIINH